MKQYQINTNPRAGITVDKDDLLLLRDAVGVARQCEDMYRGYSRSEMDEMFDFIKHILEEMQ